MGIRILFRDLCMVGIYEELRKNLDIIPHFIANSQESVDNFLSCGFTEKDFTRIFASKEKSNPDLVFLKECEEKYDFNIWDSWSVTAPRNKKRSKLKPETILSYIQYVLEKIEFIVKEVNPEYYICYSPAGYTHLIIHKVLMKNKVKIIQLKQTPIPSRFTIIKDLSNTSYLLKKSYQEIIKKGLTLEEKNKSEQFIINFQEKPLIPDCAKKFEEPFLQNIKHYTSKLYKVLKYRKFPPSFRYFFWPFIQKIHDHSGFFEKPSVGKKFILFPLHFQPEASTLIYGKEYADQHSLIEIIAKAIPVNYLLYVKEHPYGYGNRDLSFYRRIKKIPNVKLIGPHENNFLLLQNCSLVTTVTGSSGWEALLFLKPVISFGTVYYNLFPGTTKIENIENLPKIIKTKLNQKIVFDELVYFVAAMFRSSYPGLARLPNDSKNLSNETNNIKLLAEGIKSYMKHIESFSTNFIR